MMKHLLSLLLVAGLVQAAAAQEQDTPWTALDPGSDNVEVLGHIPLGAPLNTMDMEIEQELDRPYAYVSRGTVGAGHEMGTDIIDLSDPAYLARLADPGPSNRPVRMRKRVPPPAISTPVRSSTAPLPTSIRR